ncbi:MAG: N-formylglutamate deformylase [Labilithrix sp.]|nr:N-formylglutamate deformylase [Labilithrix sp.]
MPAAFTLIEPDEARESPVVVEVPHAGLFMDGPALLRLAAPARCIGRDADLYVDELYGRAPARGATLLFANVSRYVCDLNRSEQDVDAETIEGVPPTARATRGIVWRLTSDNQRVLDAPLPHAELERRLDTYYRPYHRTLGELLERKRARFGYAIVLAAHSMPSAGRGGDPREPPHVRADVVPGTRGRTSASRRLIDAVDAHARAGGLSVAHDDPYQGGYTTQHYGRPERNVHVVQVELARRLYMDEPSLQKNGGFGALEQWCASLVEVLGAVTP